MCIFVKGCLTLFYSVTSSINAGANQAISVTLSVAMIYLVVNEALLFNFLHEHCTKLCNVNVFLFLIFINTTRVIQATIPG